MIMTEEDYIEATENNDGFCTRCNEITNSGGVEPDAEDYECDECGNNTVIGIENALSMGHITFKSK